MKTDVEFWPLLSILLLASCGNLPRPFAGNPGGNAVQLATPPIARLAVLTPNYAGVDPARAKIWAGDIADALVAQQMPALVAAPSNVDWSVLPGIIKQGAMVVPHYELHDGTGKLRGTIDGTPVPAGVWDGGDAALLRQSALEAAPKIGDLLTQIEAVRMAADPRSLMNRPARVWILAGNGAPGDGDQSLSDHMRVFLRTHGVTIAKNPAEADYTVGPEVTVTDAGQNEQQVQIIWVVTDARGREAGKVAQLNDVPAHSMDGSWGEAAQDIVEQAGPGVQEVFANQLPTRKKPASS